MTDNIIIVTVTTDYCNHRKPMTEIILISFLSPSNYLNYKYLVGK